MVKDILVKNKKVFVNILAVLTFAMIPILMYLPFLLNEQIPVAGDGYASSLLVRLSTNKILFEDGFSFWNPNIEGGMPYGGYVKGILNPIYLISALFPETLNFYAYYFLHLIMGASFMFFFLKELKIRPAAAYIISIIYETSIHLNGYRKEHTEIIIAAAFVPVIMFFIQKYLNEKKLHWLIISAFMMGLQFMGGQTQNVLYFDIAVFVYLVIYLIKDRENVKRSIIHIVSWLATYIGVIAFDLLAIAHQLTKYEKISDGSIEFMSAWSIHFIKLLLGIFPNFFNDGLEEFTNLYSSGFDIELYLGIFIAFCGSFAVIKLRKNFNVKLCGVLWCVAFCFSAMAHIPYLDEIMVNIPIINSFRVPSRALFIAIFFAYVLSAHTLSEIFDKDILDKFLAYIRKLCIGIICAVSAIYVIAAAVTELGFTPMESDMDKSQFIEKCNTMFAPTFWICVLAIPVSLLIQKVRLKHILSKLPEYQSLLLCVCILACTVLETYPFSIQSYTVPFSKLDYKDDDIITAIAADDHYKLVDASESLTSSTYNLSDCGNTYRGIYGINGYLNYNNPVIYKALSGTDLQANASGSFIMLPQIRNALLKNNDMLSVLGIKYINDIDGLLEDPSFINDNNSNKSLLYEFDDFVFDPGPSNVYNMPVLLKPHTIYQLEFDMESDAIPTVVYVDTFSESDQYKNAVYGLEMGRVSLQITTDNEYYSLARIIAANEDAPISVSNIRLYQVNTALGTVDSNDIDFQKKGITLEASRNNEQGYTIFSNDGIKLEKNTDYYVEVTARSEAIPSLLYADLYAPEYDNEEQQVSLDLENGFVHTKSIINTGDIPDTVSFRIICASDSDVVVDEVSVYKVSSEVHSSQYQLFMENEDDPSHTYRIYTNPNAKDILFSTKNVKPLTEDLDYFYSNPLKYNLIESTYVLGEIDELDLTNSQTVINNIDFRSDRITAQVDSIGETFVNFSQTYDKGWKAYIDGAETQVFMTDGTIMGIKIPAGVHTIQFKYKPTVMVIGLIIPFATLLFWIAFFVVKKIRYIKKTIGKSATSNVTLKKNT